MAVLLYQNEAGEACGLEFHQQEVCVGCVPYGNQLVLPAEWSVSAHHAVILRSASNGLPVVADLAGHGVSVNGRRVVSLKVLRHGDTLAIGAARLRLREMEIKRLPLEWDFVLRRTKCPVCVEEVEAGHEVVSCPRCQTIHHRDCWFAIEACSTYGCEYRVMETVMDALAGRVKFDRSLEKETELVQLSRLCPAKSARDVIAFQEGDTVAYCPQATCRTPLHLTCWLEAARCPRCAYPIRQLLDEVFTVEGSMRFVASGRRRHDDGATRQNR